jgi:hypothetical protein
MDPDHFDVLTRTFTAARSRRGALAVVLAGALGPFGLAATVAKKKRKGKGKKGKGQNPSPPPDPTVPLAQSCAETCASNCRFCIERVAGPPLCGDSYSYVCNGPPDCSSDDDCVGTVAPFRPYCTTGAVNRATGDFDEPCPDTGGGPRCTAIVGC